MQQIQLDKSGFATPITPIGSQGMMRFAKDFEAKWNAILNGQQPFDRMAFQTATELTISSGALSAPTLALHTVKAETGTSDDLTTIGVSNNSFVVLKAKSGHSIAVRQSGGNIYIPGGVSIALTGNVMAMFWCADAQWSLIGLSHPLENVTATRDPGSTDDATQGYSVDSLWINTTLMRAWVCVDSTSGAAIWKHITPWRNSFRIETSNNGNVGVGVALASTTGSISADNGSDNIYADIFTGSTSGNTAGYTSGAATMRLDHNPIIEVYLKSYSDITNQRIWIGFTSALVNNSDTLTAATKFVGFRYSTSKPDSGWRPVTSDGTNQTEGTVIGSVAINTAYKLRIRVDSANARAYFSVNDSAEQILSTNFPAVATDGFLEVRITTLANSSAQFRHASDEVGW